MPVRRSPKRLLRLVAPFIAVVALQAMVAAMSLEVMSSVRAYAAGEAIWSRAQKDAVHALMLYLHSGDQTFYDRYRSALTVPLGDQIARTALEQPTPDLELAKSGFLQGGNHPDDVPKMIWLFRQFKHVGYLQAAIQQWAATDPMLLQLTIFGDAVKAEIHDELMKDEARIRLLLSELNDVDGRIAVRANAFSTILGEGSRAIKTLLIALNAATALLLIVLVTWHTRRLLSQREAFELALNEEKQRLAWQASHDPLTGLANRTVIATCLDEAVGRISGGQVVALHLVDLDHFKDVNDSLGHPVGDQLLKAAAIRLTNLVSSRDTVARMGGDEFAVVQPNLTCAAEAGTLAARIVEEFNKPFEIEGLSIFVGATIGISTAPTDGAAPEELTRNADLALYSAKSDGRTTYQFFHPEKGTKAQYRHALQSDLREALQRNEFEVHYQPVLSIDTGEKCSMEALVRWRHPVRGMIPPDQFIPIAEETGLIRQLGQMVLHRACEDAKRWPSEIGVAVNLSPIQFHDAHMARSIVQLLAETGLEPERLELEITESVLLHRKEENLSLLRELRDAGIRIALDDFGTGYASLSYLRTFPVDKIKIDKSFIAEISRKDESAAIVCAIANLGRALSIHTVAEGIETEEQLALVRAAGCTLVQGYLFGKPAPLREVDFGRSNMAEPAEPLGDFTPTDLMLVRSSFAKLTGRLDLAADLLYKRMFSVAPQLRQLFPDDLTAQRRKLAATLAVGISRLHDLPALEPLLKEMGARHVAYGVKSEHYALVNEAILWTLGRCLDRDFDPAMRDAWRKVLRMLSEAMQAGSRGELGSNRSVA